MRGRAGNWVSHSWQKWSGARKRYSHILRPVCRFRKAFADDWNARRRAAATKYGRLLEESRIQNPESRSNQSILNSEFGILNSSAIVPHEPDNCRAIYHLYVIRHPDRDAVMQHLKDRQIYTALHYPVPIHLQKAYAHLGYREGDFPTTEKIRKEIISLPMFPNLTETQIERVAEGIQEFTTTVSST